jgi:hypothetical protein
MRIVALTGCPTACYSVSCRMCMRSFPDSYPSTAVHRAQACMHEDREDPPGTIAIIAPCAASKYLPFYQPSSNIELQLFCGDEAKGAMCALAPWSCDLLIASVDCTLHLSGQTLVRCQRRRPPQRYRSKRIFVLTEPSTCFASWHLSGRCPVGCG